MCCSHAKPDVSIAVLNNWLFLENISALFQKGPVCDQQLPG
jgi:hypothetical protein